MLTKSHLKRESSSKTVDESSTPPMVTRPRSSPASSLDEEYFAQTYVPLSSLPTPPTSSRWSSSSSSSSSRQQSPESYCSAGETLDPEMLGPARHLTNLIPSSTSLLTPSVPVVHALLTRTALPLETLALAVCILDSLNARFALQWRQGCPLAMVPLPQIDQRIPEQHIDSIPPELIVLSALILAVKFLDDRQQRTSEYAAEWGRDAWTCAQINVTQRVLLENLGYKLLSLWQEDIILDALEDMRRAGRQYEPEPSIYDEEENWHAGAGSDAFGLGLGPRGDIHAGKALVGLGAQLTPVETPGPRVGSGQGSRDAGEETRRSFAGREGVWDGFLQMPDRKRAGREPFPLHMEPRMAFGV
ncbi:hypothetical protein B2J93_7566 [Marssonina coronariae]|uniref:Cyclin N-terminal domain-containing protein n=1 Tax=Diplocarpon coronariae TaxID=2795749 RepID=A0A218Z6C7_9HELO|nr:hypothetical protein B2J93_7566 [Marssonina coronariae]